MKPTDEWVKYCTANAWLQELWEPAVGDWYTFSDHGETLLVEHYEVDALTDDPDRVQTGDVIWLPTLSDLLGMIEELGYDVFASSWTEDDERRYEYIGCERATVETDWKSAWVWPSFQSSWELAAAELLRRMKDES